MRYSPALESARLLRRHKRFLADVVTPDGSHTTIHCPNTGAMLGCADPGVRIFMSTSDNPKRKYAHTWELVENTDGVLIGVNTGRANALVAEAIADGTIEALSGYATLKREVSIEKGSRMDFVLNDPHRRRCIVEVKNVSAAFDSGVAFFPDAVSTRALRHIDVLRRARAGGDRAVLLYCVQRDDVQEVRPAEHIHPEYAQALREAEVDGVELLAYCATLTPRSVRLERSVPVVCQALDML